MKNKTIIIFGEIEEALKTVRRAIEEVAGNDYHIDGDLVITIEKEE